MKPKTAHVYHLPHSTYGDHALVEKVTTDAVHCLTSGGYTVVYDRFHFDAKATLVGRIIKVGSKTTAVGNRLVTMQLNERQTLVVDRLGRGGDIIYDLSGLRCMAFLHLLGNGETS